MAEQPPDANMDWLNAAPAMQEHQQQQQQREQEQHEINNGIITGLRDLLADNKKPPSQRNSELVELTAVAVARILQILDNGF